MLSYLKNIIETVVTIFEGLSITFSHLVRRPMTIQYPDRIDRPVQETLPKRYRGHLEVDMEICTNCKACERECPITCIAITDSEEPDKKRWMTQFDIDLAKCMYCGICSEVCPTVNSSLSRVRRSLLQPRRDGPTLCSRLSCSSIQTR